MIYGQKFCQILAKIFENFKSELAHDIFLKNPNQNKLRMFYFNISKKFKFWPKNAIFRPFFKAWGPTDVKNN